jgi:hypothetical protein
MWFWKLRSKEKYLEWRGEFIAADYAWVLRTRQNTIMTADKADTHAVGDDERYRSNTEAEGVD